MNYKKYRFYIGILFVVWLITSCKKDEEHPYLETWRQQNEQAFNDLAENPDFIKLELKGYPGYIYYRVIQKGAGKRVYYTSKAEVYYKGWFVATNNDLNKTAGSVFDQRLFDDGETFNVTIASGIIEGWKIALQNMVEGDKWEVWIPYRLAYREEGNGSIPGFSTLAFEIELIEAIDLDDFE